MIIVALFCLQQPLTELRLSALLPIKISYNPSFLWDFPQHSASAAHEIKNIKSVNPTESTVCDSACLKLWNIRKQTFKTFKHTAPVWWECGLTTYKRWVPAFQRAGALLPPRPPQQETKQVEHKHGGLGERAEEGFVVLLSLENVLKEESTGGNC